MNDMAGEVKGLNQDSEAVAAVIKNWQELQNNNLLDRVVLFAQQIEVAPEPDKERYLPMLGDAVNEYVEKTVQRGGDREAAMKAVRATLLRQMPNLSQDILNGKFNEAQLASKLSSHVLAPISEDLPETGDHGLESDSDSTNEQPPPSVTTEFPPVLPETPQSPIPEPNQQSEAKELKKEQDKPPGEVTVSEFFYNGYLGPESHQSTMFVALNEGEKPSFKAYEVMAKHKPSEGRMKILPEADGVTFSFLVDVDSDGTGTRHVHENLAIKMKNIDPESLATWGEELSQIVFKLIEERGGRQKLLDKKNLTKVLSGELLNLQQKMRQNPPATEAGRS